VPPVPNTTEDESVPVKVSVLDTVRVFPSPIVNVEPVAGAVIATLLILVAVAAPRVGVTKVGDVDMTTLPLPVIALLTKFLFASENTACDAVNAET
jgi:hypothetical protein